MTLDSSTFTKMCNGTILAGTGRGLFGSRDGARSWSRLGLDGVWVRAIVEPRCDELFAVVQNLERWIHSVVRSTDQGATWSPASDGLTGHPISTLSADDQGTAYAAGVAGAFRRSRGGVWAQIGPTNVTVPVVVATPWNSLYAVAGSVFRADADNGRWRMLLVGDNAHISPHGPGGDSIAYSAGVTSQGDLLVGTQLGVLRSRDRGETWRRVGLTAIVHTFLSTGRGSIFAGTDNGIFRSTDAETWVERSIGLSAFRISSLAVGPDGTVYAGTADGNVFRSSNDGNRWRPLLAPRGSSTVHTLVVLRSGRVLAGTRSGLSAWEAGTQLWQPIPLKLEQRTPAVRAIVQAASGAVLAGTEDAEVFASFDDGMTWEPAKDGLTAERLFSLSADAAGHVVAGTSAGVFRTTVDRRDRGGR